MKPWSDHGWNVWVGTSRDTLPLAHTTHQHLLEAVPRAAQPTSEKGREVWNHGHPQAKAQPKSLCHLGFGGGLLGAPSVPREGFGCKHKIALQAPWGTTYLKVILDGGGSLLLRTRWGGCLRALKDPEVRDDGQPQIGWDSVLWPCL